MKPRQPEKREQDARLPPGQSVAHGFPVLTYGPTPRLDKARLELRVSGLATPRTFDWEALIALPRTSVRRDFHCVTHWSKFDVGWTGVLTGDLTRELELPAEASHVMLRCYGGYATNLALEDFLAEGCLLAWQLEGEDIAAEHGGPLRAVIPHLYAWKSAKWLNELHFMSGDEPGFWERNGYHMRGDPFAEERFA
ncbi:MAG TPA: sulfite oxidase-like oxidoreductase [Trueperaceae bacterium]|nr:sulfite oxidase-like oxidoreductase [Trueperaceae bacterium]